MLVAVHGSRVQTESSSETAQEVVLLAFRDNYNTDAIACAMQALLCNRRLPCNMARVYVCALTQVLQCTAANAVVRPPEDGIFVDGLWVDGARWDLDAMCLVESKPGVMWSPLPVVHFKPVQDCEPPPSEYQCPLYKTSVRAGVLSTTGQSTNFVLCVSLPVKAGTKSDFWVLQGVALLCMLDS
jgi:dynein heavy chain